MVPGDVMLWEWGFLESDTILVRVCALMSDQWCVSRGLSGRKALVQVSDDEVLERADRDAISVTKAVTEQFPWTELSRNVTVGSVPSDCLLVSQNDLVRPAEALMRYLEQKWRGLGFCPQCGSEGEWVTLALRCRDHGVF